MVGVSGLHPTTDRLLERDGALGVPTILAIAPAYPFRIHNVWRAMAQVGKRMTAKAPSSVEVVLGSGAVDSGQSVAIDKDHVVTLAEPNVLVLLDGLGHTPKMSLARGLHEDVVVLTGQVLSFVDAGTAIDRPVVGPSPARRGLAILRMETAYIAGKAGQGNVVDGEIKIVSADFAFVGECEAGGAGKRHREVGVEPIDGRHIR